MRKTNLFKGIVCGLMFTALVGSAVYAGTGSGSAYGYNDTYVADIFYGDVGSYRTVATSELTNIYAKNTSNSSKMYYVEAQHYLSTTGDVIELDAVQEVLDENEISSKAYVIREYDDVYASYFTIGKGYYGASTATGLADYYTYDIYQLQQ